MRNSGASNEIFGCSSLPPAFRSVPIRSRRRHRSPNFSTTDQYGVRLRVESRISGPAGACPLALSGGCQNETAIACHHPHPRRRWSPRRRGSIRYAHSRQFRCAGRCRSKTRASTQNGECRPASVGDCRRPGADGWRRPDRQGGHQLRSFVELGQTGWWDGPRHSCAYGDGFGREHVRRRVFQRHGEVRRSGTRRDGAHKRWRQRHLRGEVRRGGPVQMGQTSRGRPER